MNANLAIVIPAYKSKYFKQTLDSISKQTCKDFTLYIGDDGSNSNILEIVNQYSDRIDIRYHYFEKNLGSTDLVAQWERCLDLMNEEKWIWFFSDDDLMGENCVQEFYRQKSNLNYDIYHFDTRTIDSDSQILRVNEIYPKILNAYDFYKLKMSAKIESYAVEYIFSRDKFLECNRFQKFDLAWGSDIATWIKISSEKGIFTLNNAYVYWRSSELNITPNNSVRNVMRKVSANIDFFNWANTYFNDNNIYINYYFLFRIFVFYSNILNVAAKNSDFKDFCEQKRVGRIYLLLLNLIFPSILVIKKIRLKYRYIIWGCK